MVFVEDWQLIIPELLISKWVCIHGMSISVLGSYLYRSTNHLPRSSFASSKSREYHDGQVTFLVPQKVPFYLAKKVAAFQPIFVQGMFPTQLGVSSLKSSFSLGRKGSFPRSNTPRMLWHTFTTIRQLRRQMVFASKKSPKNPCSRLPRKTMFVHAPHSMRCFFF